MSNDFDTFSELPSQLQIEAIREGEARLQSQLEVATAADSRALTWGGLLVAAVTGSLGAGLALLGKSHPDYLLSAIALALATAFLVASQKVLATVDPQKFHLPGNTPAHWPPSEWGCNGTDNRKIAQARVEQAEALSNAIESNAVAANRNAEKMRASFGIVRVATATAALALLVVLSYRLLMPTVLETLQQDQQPTHKLENNESTGRQSLLRSYQ